MTDPGEKRSLEEMKPRPFLVAEFQIRFQTFWTSFTLEYIPTLHQLWPFSFEYLHTSVFGLRLFN